MNITRALLLGALLASICLPPDAAAQARPRKRLNDSDDPLLSLTNPILRVSGEAKTGSAPPSADPRDFEGVWWISRYEYLLGPEPGVPPPLKPEYMQILERRIRAKNQGVPEADASTDCRPHGMPRVMESPYPIRIVQTPGQVTLLHEVAHNIRRLHIGRDAPKDWPASYLGFSSARWEGDTLVVRTTHLNDKTFIDDEGSAHSDRLEVVERFRKINGGRELEVHFTITDPVTLTQPYSYTRTYKWRPDVRPAEYVCEENNRNAPENGVTVAK
ncbi:MAG: hypothetical protein RL026_2444 [Pseudomonadota bacterium]